MTAHQPIAGFLAGAIEGFYGPPWTSVERLELFDRMTTWGLNTYFYAPKDDLKQRALWRETYSTTEAGELRQLVEACAGRGIHFIYGLSPGLDIRYADESDLGRIRQRFEQVRALGCRGFALLFDDLPGRLDGADRTRWDSPASAQSHVANAIHAWLREREPSARLLFCPTAYCGRMVQAGLGGPDYLATIGRELLPEIDTLWTGPDIISREIPVAHVQDMQRALRRRPIIWDNLHANDYDGRRFFCGPYSGRPPELLNEVGGLLSNPNCEPPLNFVPLRTLAEFVRCTGSWDARSAYLSAMQEWLPAFATIGLPVDLEDLILFGDCYYLPHEEGPEAVALYESARSLLSRDPAEWGKEATVFRNRAARLRDFCTRLTELRNRPLFHALSRRAWELHEELDLLDRYVNQALAAAARGTRVSSDFHLEGTYRGGMVARLQRLLAPGPDGTFAPAWRTKSRGEG
jgi:protein O-GlcNAcase/histone acetyltransferase